ncbi:hypothetical protein HF521_021517 [Silurus meridionalis]|uniref:Uncharacterized protein n=1 Tax=Silurus meridionalis TaxID=175797 RepID=A0A8T0BBQ5_SILME|nr:hypothetical protein HF521_021517 [Silurus meridionalis]
MELKNHGWTTGDIKVHRVLSRCYKLEENERKATLPTAHQELCPEPLFRVEQADNLSQSERTVHEANEKVKQYYAKYIKSSTPYGRRGSEHSEAESQKEREARGMKLFDDEPEQEPRERKAPPRAPRSHPCLEVREELRVTTCSPKGDKASREGEVNSKLVRMEGEVRITPLDQEEDLESVAELKKEVKGIEELARKSQEQVAANYRLVQEGSKLLNTSLKHFKKTYEWTSEAQAEKQRGGNFNETSTETTPMVQTPPDPKEGRTLRERTLLKPPARYSHAGKPDKRHIRQSKRNKQGSRLTAEETDRPSDHSDDDTSSDEEKAVYGKSQEHPPQQYAVRQLPLMVKGKEVQYVPWYAVWTCPALAAFPGAKAISPMDKRLFPCRVCPCRSRGTADVFDFDHFLCPVCYAVLRKFPIIDGALLISRHPADPVRLELHSWTTLIEESYA